MDYDLEIYILDFRALVDFDEEVGYQTINQTIDY
jgi:hypothetical protein